MAGHDTIHARRFQDSGATWKRLSGPVIFVHPRNAVITGETPSGSLKRPKIPDVCLAIGVEPIGLLDLIRREGWVFR